MRLGKTDVDVGLIGVGTWQAGFKSWGAGYTKRDVIEALQYAFENGVRLIDTAEIYGWGLSEEVVGEAIKEYPDVLVATKVAGFHTSPGRIIKSAEESRRRLGVDAIDLYQLHWPPSIYTNLCRVIRSLERLIDFGIVRYIGLSNFDEPLLRKALECLRRHEIVSNQIQYSLVYRRPETGVKQYMEERGITLIAYSPLGKGVLAGKTVPDNLARRLDPVFNKARKDVDLQRVLDEIASKRGVSKASVALRWLVEKEAYPIPGVKKKSHVESIIDAMELRLSPEDMKMLDEATEKYVDGVYKTPFPRAFPAIITRLMIRLIGGV